MAQPLNYTPPRIDFYPPPEGKSLRKLVLVDDYHWQDGHTTVAGFVWNGASAPLGRQRFLIASCRHDEDYDTIIEMLETHRYKGKVSKAIRNRAKNMRKNADLRFRHNVRIYDHNGGFWAWTGYLGVRIGGAFAIWQGCKEYRKNNSIKEAK